MMGKSCLFYSTPVSILLQSIETILSVFYFTYEILSNNQMFTPLIKQNVNVDKPYIIVIPAFLINLVNVVYFIKYILGIKFIRKLINIDLLKTLNIILNLYTLE